jgi:hypothetical protein
MPPLSSAAIVVLAQLSLRPSATTTHVGDDASAGDRAGGEAKPLQLVENEGTGAVLPDRELRMGVDTAPEMERLSLLPVAPLPPTCRPGVRHRSSPALPPAADPRAPRLLSLPPTARACAATSLPSAGPMSSR